MVKPLLSGNGIHRVRNMKEEFSAALLLLSAK